MHNEPIKWSKRDTSSYKREKVWLKSQVYQWTHYISSPGSSQKILLPSLDETIYVNISWDLNISYLFRENDNTLLWICGSKKTLIIFRFRIILWSILTFFRVSHFCRMSFPPFCPPILKPYLKKRVLYLCEGSLFKTNFIHFLPSLVILTFLMQRPALLFLVQQDI